MSFKRTGISIALVLTSIGTAQALHAAESAAKNVEIVPAIRVAASEKEQLTENNKILHSNQDLIRRVLAHEGVDHYDPVLPKYNIMSANSVISLTDQFYYSALAKKLGAPLPEKYEAKSGEPLLNNRFLHGYNNEILRCIANKLGIKTPERVKDESGLPSQAHLLILQNHQILTAVATKLGVK